MYINKTCYEYFYIHLVDEFLYGDPVGKIPYLNCANCRKSNDLKEWYL